jgi:hypothetical protein
VTADENSLTVELPALRPVTDPLEVKNLAVREYVEKARRAGVEPDMPAIEAFAQREVEIADAYSSHHPPGDVRSPTVSREDHPDPVAELAQKERVDLRNVSGQQRQKEPNIGAVNPRSVSLRFEAAAKRIAQILAAGVGETKVSDFRKAIAATEMPKLAQEYMEGFTHYTLRHRQSRFNPFAGMSDADASRKWLRMIEDICDRSTGKLGPWWVK